MNLSGVGVSREVRLLDPTSRSRIIDRRSNEWPPLLSELGPHQPPGELHAVGAALDPRALHIAVVGPRRPSAAGLEVTKELVRGLVEAECTVVSGLAVGIDGAAHKAALDAGGKTVAVVGCGLDVDYPVRNKQLRKLIEDSGTVLSEYPEGTPPLAHHFPARNRIVAGMSAAVIVIEGTMKSGALITARLALDANRAVFAVPGSFRNPLAEGPNELIRTCQAGLATRIEHVFQELAPNLVWRERVDPLHPKAPDLEPIEKQVLVALDDVPATPDQVAMVIDATPGEVALAIARLEVRGLLVQKGSGYEISTGGARARSAVISHQGRDRETEGS